jgi:GAF domain-containing protein
MVHHERVETGGVIVGETPSRVLSPRQRARLRALLTEARRLTAAEAGTVYVRDGKHLQFVVAHNDVLTGRLGQRQARRRLTGEPLSLAQRSIASYCALTRAVVNIADVYAIPPDRPYTFNSRFDVKNEYRTRSMITLPLRDPQGVFGVLQLINRRNAQGDVVPFDEDSERALKQLLHDWSAAGATASPASGARPPAPPSPAPGDRSLS